MNRIILCIAIGVAAVAPARHAFADDPPTKEQLEQAKKVYAEGKTLHDQGKLVEAVDKFKESYRLSKSPLLLYNIGLTLDEAGQKDNALLYYRKFLSDAPANAAQRKTATDRVKVLEKEKLDADLAGGGSKPDTGTTKPDTGTTKPDTGAVTTKPDTGLQKPDEEGPKKPVKVKPAGTYSATDFQHQAVDSAPPKLPLDVTAFVPEDSGWTVTLYYRGKGETEYTQKPMKWRYKELVARIPAAKLVGGSIQYYIEVKDAAGKKVTSAGKSVDPNLVTIETGAKPRYYPDLPDENGALPPPIDAKPHADENPLATTPGTGPPRVEDNPMVGNGEQPKETPSSGLTYARWGTTAGAVALLGVAVGSYIAAGNQASNLQTDAKSCGAPPCRKFDSYDKSVQDSGKRFETFYYVSLTGGIIAAGVAGYLWYRELTHKKKVDATTTASGGGGPEQTWIVVPSIGDGFAGAAAAARW